MKSQSARLTICVLFAFATLGAAFGQSQQRVSPLAANPSRAHAHREKKSSVRTNSMSTNPTTSIGLLSAIQIPAGPQTGNCSFPSCAQSTSPYPGVLGNFLGPSGGEQMATMVLAHHQPPNGEAFAIAVMAAVSGGTGSGAFKAKLTLPNTPLTEFDRLLAADLNGDGYTDLVAIQANGDYLVFLNNTSAPGSFLEGTSTPISSNAILGATLVAQPGNTPPTFNLIAVDGATPSKVWTLVGASNGTFGTPSSFTLSTNLSSGDLNTVVFGNFVNHTDGLIDFVANAATTPVANEPIVFINNGSGYTPQALTTSDTNYDSCFNTVGNLSTKNGPPDILSANCTDNNITVFVNNGSGTFASGVYYDVLGAPNAVAVTDVNADGNNDVLSTNKQSADVATLLGNGDGTLQAQTAGFVTGGTPVTPAVPVANPNSSGHVDLLVGDNEYSFAWLQGNGDGTFDRNKGLSGVNYYGQTGPGIGNGPLPQGASIATGDFNGDGIPDFVIGNTNNLNDADITVFLSNPDGTLQPGVNYSSNSATADLQYVAVADFNGDGILDIAATDSTNGGVQIFTGNGDGTFTPLA
ncbi:MAG TPA: VCBS repeat-containing protein, partial [Terriglobales bacterium]